MNDFTLRKIKTGSDPRSFTGYAALHHEMSKLTHPARPDVNWLQAEKLCHSLFENNGVDLQTAAWYVHIRTQLTGLSGLNEGLEILEPLLSYQWDVFWPQAVHIRMEILSNLIRRLLQMMRMMPLHEDDLSQLYRAEQLLTRLGTVLPPPGMMPPDQLQSLCALIHNHAARLKNSATHTAPDNAVLSEVVLSAPAIPAAEASVETPGTVRVAGTSPADNVVKWVYVLHQEHPSDNEIAGALPKPVKKAGGVMAGMCCMLLICLTAIFSWHYFHRPDPIVAQLLASVTPLPFPLSPVQTDSLRLPPGLSEKFMIAAQQQLNWLDKLPPDWNFSYSRQLLQQIQELWPEQGDPLVSHWQQQIKTSALPAGNMNGWHEGMEILQRLSSRLNALDGQKGKYMTVSELKSVVFSARQAFNQSVPAEEQLRILSERNASMPLSVADKVQLEIHLKQLISRYAEIKQQTDHKN